MTVGGTKQAAAGTKGHVARKNFTHDKYRGFGWTDIDKELLSCPIQNKLGLSCIDDKRVVL